MNKKRKPWRRFRRRPADRRRVRRLCFFFIAAELLVLGCQKTLPFPAVEFTEDKEIIIYRIPSGEDSGIPDLTSDRIYGIRVRLKEVVIDFYRQEEIRREYCP